MCIPSGCLAAQNGAFKARSSHANLKFGANIGHDIGHDKANIGARASLFSDDWNESKVLGGGTI